MKQHGFLGALVCGRHLAWMSAGALLVSSMAAAAATDIQVWHTLNPYNSKVFENLVKDFNKSQKDVKVELKAFNTPEDIEAALAKTTKQNKPNLVQLDDARAPDDIAKRPYIVPLHILAAKYPVKDLKWFLAEGNTFIRDAKGQLLAFPYMVDVPVMYYSIDAFKKAGLQPTVPQRSWKGLQDQLVTLANNGSRRCPMTSDQTVSINLENLAAVNNQPYTTEENGLKKGKGSPVFTFDSMYIRHLSMMISWVRTELMVKPEFDAVAAKRFANGECAVLMSTSSNLGWFKDSKKLDFGVSGLPYYPEVTQKPGNPFVGGSALWAISGLSKESDAASIQLLAWLAQPAQASHWFQSTGFLPLTKQAFDQTDGGYYKSLGDWRNLVAVYASNPPVMSRGFRINNYPKIKAMFRQKLDGAFNGQQPAVTALKSASAEAGQIMRER
ncbi:extracellular solute-binding protein [Alcaligenaceae bacterium]|nr:extracellular solute-binding protein [Alcaligenaceae bacterium]